MLLGSRYPYNWVTDRPYSTVDTTPEVMKRAGYHLPPSNVSPSLLEQPLHPPRAGKGCPAHTAQAGAMPLHP